MCVCARIFVATHTPFPRASVQNKSHLLLRLRRSPARLGTGALTFSCLPFYFILFFKSTQQVKRQGESIMQIMSLCIMSHDWNMQMSCIIYECQCLSKSVSHNLQSELETRVGAARLSPLPGKLRFPVNAIRAFSRCCVRDSKCSGKAKNKCFLKVCKILQL